MKELTLELLNNMLDTEGTGDRSESSQIKP